MPTEMDLINAEKIASIFFIISGFQALFSSFDAEQSELKKRQNTNMNMSRNRNNNRNANSNRNKNRNTNNNTSSGIDPAAISSIQQAIDSTWTGIIGYLIFLIAAEFRKEQLEQQIESGTTNISIIPNILIISGFVISTIGTIIRLPALEQRLAEAQGPVIL